MKITVKLRYAAAQLEEHQKAEAYRFYCTTALKCIADNTKAICGGSAPDKTFWEIIHGSKTEPEKDPEKIIEEITKKAGLTMID